MGFNEQNLRLPWVFIEKNVVFPMFFEVGGTNVHLADSCQSGHPKEPRGGVLKAFPGSSFIWFLYVFCWCCS